MTISRPENRVIASSEAHIYDAGPLSLALSAAGATALILVGLVLQGFGEAADTFGMTFTWLGVVGLCLVGLVVLFATATKKIHER